MTREALETAIFDLVQPYLDISTIWAKEITSTGVIPDRPATPYATLEILSSPAQDFGDWTQAEDQGGGDWQATLTEDLRVLLQVDVYGPGGFDAIRALGRELSRQAGQDAAGSAGVGFLTLDGPRDLSGLEGVGFEKRAQADLVFHVLESTTFDEGYIGRVDVSATMEPGSIPVTISKTAP